MDGPLYTQELRSAILSCAESVSRNVLSLSDGDVVSEETLSMALTSLNIPSSISATEAATELLRKWCLKIPGKRKTTLQRVLSALLRNFPFSHGPPLIHELLVQVKSRHCALHHKYLNRLSGRGNALPFPNPRAAILDLARNYAAYNASFSRILCCAIEKLKSSNHVTHLRNDLAEENGKIDDEDVHGMKNAGIEREWVDRIPHKKLFQNFLQRLEETTIEAEKSAVPPDSSPGDTFCSAMSELVCGSTSEAFVVGAMSVGTEAVVKDIYEQITEGIKAAFPELSLQDYVFFPLHVVVDDAHAAALLAIAQDVITREPNISEPDFVNGAMAVLDSRTRLWDQLLTRAEAMVPEGVNADKETLGKEGLQTSLLYNRQASRWVRKKPTCLSDFTARPRILDMLEPLKDKHVLDVGCGEGYLARLMRGRMGAASVVGVDVSSSMVAAAKEEEMKNALGGLTFEVGNATNLLNTIRLLGPGCVPNYLLPCDTHELFHSAVACFLFNYMSVSDMERAMSQVYELLKPGGQFVFSVPHPCFPFWKTESFEMPFRWDALHMGYFSRDEMAEGIIMTRDGRKLDVRCVHKTFDTYFNSLRKCGFTTMPEVKELGVTEELLQLDRTFFGALQGIPLHLAFSVMKPDVDRVKRSPEILWGTGASGMKDENFLVEPSEACRREALMAARKLIVAGFKPDTVCPAELANLNLENVRAFGHSVRTRLCSASGTGAVLTCGLFPNLADCDKETMKMIYFLVSSFIGSVHKDRKALWDVCDRGLRTDDEDVLFSLTNEQATFHTDGSRRDFFPDVVGLLCLEPAREGGELSLSNACNAYYSLKARLHSDTLKVLESNVVHDIIEGGVGKQKRTLEDCKNIDDIATTIRDMVMREERVLALRILDNSYPIFDRKDGRIRFRYMRKWIESGYRRSGTKKEGLSMAMDELDRELKVGMRRKLQRGEIVWTNNHVIAHAREAFSCRERHMVRIWLDCAL